MALLVVGVPPSCIYSSCFPQACAALPPLHHHPPTTPSFHHLRSPPLLPMASGIPTNMPGVMLLPWMVLWKLLMWCRRWVFVDFGCLSRLPPIFTPRTDTITPL